MRRSLHRRAATRAAFAMSLLMAAPAIAQPAAPTPAPDPLPLVQSPPGLRIERMALEAGTGRIVVLAAPAASLFAADPRIAEMRPASPTSVFVFGVAPGRTTLAAMDSAGAPLVQWEVTVRPSAFLMSDLQSALRRAFPGNRSLRVEAGPGGIVVSGQVTAPADAERAQTLLRSRLENERIPIDNRISVTGVTQVNLRVRVAEVSREVTRQLGVNWQALGSIGRIGTLAGGPAGLAFETFNFAFDRTAPSDRIGLGFRTGAAELRDINAVIDALAQDRLVNILAEPNLTATSGETASFLAGGEFPIPVSQRENQVTIEFKQFGVGLAFVPTVMSDGRISFRIRSEVSELSEQGAVRLLSGNNNAITVPALTVRRAETTVELGSGQAFAIAGLLQDSSRQTGRALPLVGEVPILGALFRSDRFQRNETELVIIITPYLVRPAESPRALSAPTDGFVPPNDVERILLLRQSGRGAAPPAQPRGQASRALSGNPGFVLD
jgi:pilus assembly protein CpaC